MSDATKSTGTATETPSMHVDPQPEHRWLGRLVGDWTYEMEADPQSSAEGTEKASGTEKVYLLGEIWAIAEGRGNMPGGGEGHTRMTLGYDPERRRFTGSWVGSMMTHLWIYDGELDATGKVLTLNSKGPDMTGKGSTTPYQDIITFVNDDERTLTARVQSPDGSWQQFMVARYRRRRS